MGRVGGWEGGRVGRWEGGRVAGWVGALVVGLFVRDAVSLLCLFVSVCV